MKYYKILHIPTGKYLRNCQGFHTIKRYLEDIPSVYTQKTLDNIFPKNYTFLVCEDIKTTQEVIAMNYIEFEIIELGEDEWYYV
jgi:tRNA A37 threonylcarbamoyladenosine synthetase subunit TsaC/SUA5/YrdC